MDFYTRFTNHFRGEKGAIKDRLTVYIPLLAPIMARYPEAQVVDLGSGRGDGSNAGKWLRKVSIQTKGV